MKKNSKLGRFVHPHVRKLWLIMRITTFLLLAISLSLSASVYSQTTRLSLDYSNATIREVLRNIEDQSTFKFLLQDERINIDQRIDIQMDQADIYSILDKIFGDKSVSYTVTDKNLIIIKPLGSGKSNPVGQVKTVSGQVKDESGGPLPGVTVVIKGTTKGTITNSDGNFNITDVSSEDVLVFSFVGLKTQELPVGSKTVFNVTMEESSIGLSEVVAVGYGTQKRATLTGSVETIPAEKLESRAVTNPVLALQGATPGLVISRTSSRPGNENIDMQIRGASSISGNVQPLIVIDGVPMIDASQSTTSVKGNGNAFFDMNSDDIESISVLKDGMAAIYGSRAAGGVILVTTKRGKGKMKVDIGSTIRLNTMGIRTPSANMQEYAKMFLAANAEEPTPTWWFADKDVMEKLVQGESGFYPTAHWGTMYIGQGDRYTEMFQPRLSNQNNISVSGATDKTNFRISGAYANNQGNLATAYDGQKQYNLRLNYDYQITNGIKLTSNISYQKDKTSSPSGGLGFSLVSQDPPLFPAKNPYGQWHSNFHNAGNRNAAALTTDGGRDNKENDMIRVDLKTTIKLIKDLQFEGSASWQSNQYRRDLYKLKVPLYEWDGTPAAGALNNTPSISAESDNTFYQNYTALLRYTKVVGNHRFGIMTGLTAEHNQWKGLYAYREGITNNGVYDLNAVPLDKATSNNSGGQDQWGLYSYLARINYSFKDKYLLDVLGRSDGSSRFAAGSKVSNFYNVGVGWVLTNENFIKNLNLSFLDYMKLKGSVGETGLQSGIGTFDYYSVIDFSSVALGVSPAAVSSSSVHNNGLSMNPTTTWERVKMMNAGVEMHLFQNRLMGEFNYYKKQNDGMLINVTYPSVLGASAPKSNSGVLDVHGWEVSLNWQDKIGKVTYTIGANMSDSRNELKKYAGAETIAAGLVNDPGSSSGAWKVGYPVNSWFMYQTDGYFKDEADVDAYYNKYTSNNVGELSGYEPASGGNTYQGLRPGDTKKVDLDGNGYISALGNGTSDKGDVKFMGDAAKHYVFGLNFGAKFKGFDFTAFFQGQLQNYIQRSDALAYPFVVIYTNQNAAFLGKTWTQDNPNAEFPRMSVNNIRNRWNYQNNDFMLQNNKYIRLKSLIIGYTVPSQLTERVKIDKLRVYFSGNDLWEATTLKDGYDPEQGVSSNNSGYPFMRTWALGLNVSF